MPRYYILLLLFITSLRLGFAQTGCTDPQATNYDPNAIENDGSCLYDDLVVTPVLRTLLDDDLEEISGLLYYQNRLFGINDSGNEAAIYELDTITGDVIAKYHLIGTENVDWECMTRDDQYAYIGDTGNNQHGNRKDLKIYKFPLTALLSDGPIPADAIETISFHYEDQTDFSAKPKNHTRFDCEAMICLGDSLYLFAKDWVHYHTRYYALPKTATGEVTAQLRDSLPIMGLVTDVTTVNDSIIILLGSFVDGHFLELLYDYKPHHFFAGNKRKIHLSHSQLGQPEGIAPCGGEAVFLSTEKFKLGGMSKKQALFKQSVGQWFAPVATTGGTSPNLTLPAIYPNPANGSFRLRLPADFHNRDLTWTWLDDRGHRMCAFKDHFTPATAYHIPFFLKDGHYYLELSNGNRLISIPVIVAGK